MGNASLVPRCPFSSGEGPLEARDSPGQPILSHDERLLNHGLLKTAVGKVKSN